MHHRSRLIMSLLVLDIQEDHFSNGVVITGTTISDVHKFGGNFLPKDF